MDIGAHVLFDTPDGCIDGTLVSVDDDAEEAVIEMDGDLYRCNLWLAELEPA